MPKALIFGTGGVGCIYGFILSQAGCSVTTVCRSNFTAVRDNGITVRSKIFGNASYRPTAVQTVRQALEHGPFDYIVVTVKAFPGTAHLIKEAVAPSTTIVLGQNGIGGEKEYAELYPESVLIVGVVYLPVTQVEPGIVEHGPLERFEVGTYPPDASPEAKKRCRELSDLFRAGGGSAPVFDDIQPQRWFKLAVNAAWNPTTALTMCDDANYLRSSPKAEDMIRKIMKDVAKIATAVGYPDAVTDQGIEHDLQRPKGRLDTGGKEPSMLTDVRNGRATEVEAILGNALRIGQERGVDTPYLELICILAKGRDYAIAPDERWKPIARHG
ncbi:hypothetical protein KC330_g4522 [Hortaea werneckii]|nr:hypothetical protein KC330_g4522 [Hortaea werneckii]